MISFQNEVRIRVLTALGIISVELLDNPQELDGAIITIADRILSKSELHTFFFAFSDTDDWEHVQRRIHDAFLIDFDVKTIRRYATRAIDRIATEAPTAAELSEFKNGLVAEKSSTNKDRSKTKKR